MIDSKNPVIEFTAHDRCDRCHVAQAYMRAERDGMELFFCGHHGRESHLALELDGWKMTYDTSSLSNLYEPEPVTVNA